MRDHKKRAILGNQREELRHERPERENYGRGKCHRQVKTADSALKGEMISRLK